ncbi:MAG: peroxiredoxin [Bacteroidia bacterium]|jgi:peroxiredoxin
MKTILITLIAIFTLNSGDSEQINIGDKAPQSDLKMTGINGAAITLADAKMENGLCVIFSCNTCPYVIAWEDRYNELYKECANSGVGLVVVNSNEAKREGADSIDEMKKHAKEKGYLDFAYLVDENHALADAFGATKTPDVFLFNRDMELVYKGAIDDNMKDKSDVAEPYLKNAVSAMVAGKEINPNATKAIGCSIKRVKS